MTTAGAEIDSSIGLPYLHSSITACRDDERAIGRPGHSIHSISMTCIGEKMISLDDLPYLSSFVVAHRDDMRAIGRPGHSIHSISKTVIADDEASQCCATCSNLAR